MKNLKKYYIGTLSILLIFSSCNKDLNLKPHQQIEQNQAILTAADVQITLTGAYNRMGQSYLYGGGVFLYPDMLATPNLINWFGTYQELTQMNSQTIINDNDFVNLTWLYAYEVINQTNNVLANISKVGADNKDRVEGEAKFLRGLVYFDLVRLFGRAWNDGTPADNPGVPIVLTPTTVISPASYVTRSTVAQVYQQAISDLTDAEAKLPEDNSYLANKYSASAILARLYLQKGDYPNAITEATNVIDNGGFTLNANYADEFPYPNGNAVHVDNTSEDIFAIQVTAQQGINSLNTYYASSSNGGRGDIHIRASFLTSLKFEAGDTRAQEYAYDDPTDPTTVLRCHKFDNLYGNVHVIRLAELYLIRAEANIRNGTATGGAPVDDINVIRERAGASDMTSVKVNDVLTERVRELGFEGGFFLHDAKRTNNLPDPITNTPVPTFAGSLPSFSPKLVFPIPKQDINANPKLTQNPGY